MTTAVTGNFVQTSSGTYWVDVDLDPSADRLTISGTASVSGLIKLNVMNAGGAIPGVHQETILSAAGGLINHSGLHLEAPHSVLANFRLLFPGDGIVLQYNIDFAPDALHCPNKEAVGNAINRIQRDGVASFQPVAATLFSLTSIDQVAAAYESLSGEGTSAVQQATFSLRSLVFDAVMQNGTLSRDAESADLETWSKQRWRGWSGGYGGSFSLDGSACEAGTQTTGGGAVMGAEIDRRPSEERGARLVVEGVDAMAEIDRAKDLEGVDDRGVAVRAGDGEAAEGRDRSSVVERVVIAPHERDRNAASGSAENGGPGGRGDFDIAPAIRARALGVESDAIRPIGDHVLLGGEGHIAGLALAGCALGENAVGALAEDIDAAGGLDRNNSGVAGPTVAAGEAGILDER